MLKKMLRGADTLVALEDMTSLAPSATETFAVPAWAVGAVGATVVLSGVMYFVWRVRSSRRAPRPPTSVRPAAGKIR
jgi:hypothetical protein